MGACPTWFNEIKKSKPGMRAPTNLKFKESACVIVCFCFWDSSGFIISSFFIPMKQQKHEPLFSKKINKMVNLNSYE